MAGSADAVRGLLEDIGKVETAAETALAARGEQESADASELENVVKEAGEAKRRAERAEKVVELLKKEREVIRAALRSVSQRGTGKA